MGKTGKAASRTTQSGIPPGLTVRIKDWHAILIIVLAVAFFFRDILLQKAFFWEDFIYQYYAFRNFAAVSMAHGEIPLWNPYTFCGMPFQADIQTALFYLPNLLLTLFVGGGKLNFAWVELLIIVHFVIAGVSMYYLAKELGIARVFALFSGLVYALSGFMVMQLIHQTFVCEAAWLPLIVLLFRRALLKRSLLSMALGAIVLGHAILAGAPQLTLYIFFFLLLYFVFEFFASSRLNGLRASVPMVPIAAGFIIIAIALTAMQLIPTQELAGLSQRAELSYEKSLDGSLQWEQLMTLLVPRYFGASGAQDQTFWLSPSYWQYWETCCYIGLVALVAVAASVRLVKRNRYVAFFAAIAIFGILYALGGSFFLHPLFYRFVPGFDKFRSPGRMAFFFTIGTALLSGYGLQHLVESMSENLPRFRKFIFGIAGAGIAIWLLAQSGVFQNVRNAQQALQIHSLASGEATTAMILLLVIAGILYMASRRTISVFAAVVALLVLQFIDINVFAFNQNNGNTNPDEYYARNQDIVDRLREDGKNEYFRINSRSGGAMLLDRNQGMVDRIFMMEGYTPLNLERKFPPGKDGDQILDMLNAKYRIRVDAKNQRMEMVTDSNYLPRAFMVYGARVIRDEQLVQSFMTGKDFDPWREVVLEADPQFPLDDTSATRAWSAAITSYSLNSLSMDVTTPKRGYLVLSEVFYPGWNAYVDGVRQAVYRADWCLRATPLQSGTHHVEVRFEPQSFHQGLWISLATFILVLLGIVFLIVWNRKKPGSVIHPSMESADATALPSRSS